MPATAVAVQEDIVGEAERLRRVGQHLFFCGLVDAAGVTHQLMFKSASAEGVMDDGALRQLKRSLRPGDALRVTVHARELAGSGSVLHVREATVLSLSVASNTGERRRVSLDGEPTATALPPPPPLRPRSEAKQPPSTSTAADADPDGDDGVHGDGEAPRTERARIFGEWILRSFAHVLEEPAVTQSSVEGARPYTASVRRLARAAFPELADAGEEEGEEEEEEDLLETLCGVHDPERCLVLLCWLPSRREPVGFALLCRLTASLHVANLCVDAALRRRGLGALLLRSSSALAASMGLHKLTGSVAASSPHLLDFYARLGAAALPPPPCGPGAAILTRRLEAPSGPATAGDAPVPRELGGAGGEAGGRSGVLDVAGGRGELSLHLTLAGQRATLIDPRPSALAKWQRKLLRKSGCEPFGVRRELFGEAGGEAGMALARGAALVVGLHTDEVTEAIVDAALAARTPFAVVPCCVFSRLFPGRRLRSGRPVTSHPSLVAYLLEKHPAVRSARLGFAGKDVVVFCTDYGAPSDAAHLMCAPCDEA